MKDTIKALDKAISDLNKLKASLRKSRNNYTVYIKLDGVPMIAEISGDEEDYDVERLFVEDSEIDIQHLVNYEEVLELINAELNDLP